MLDAFIIEQLRRREQEERNRHRPVLELPIDDGRDMPRPGHDEEEEIERGVVVIDL